MPFHSLSIDSLAVIRVSGPQAADLLHAQLSQDVLHWDSAAARLAALCTPQGRMLADLWMVRRGPEEILLLLDASIAPAILQRLKMFVLRLQCKLDDATTSVGRYGLLGEADSALPPDLGMQWPAADWDVRPASRAGMLVRLPQPDGRNRALVLVDRAAAGAETLETALSNLAPLTA